jgi:hypothetical protein
MAIWELEPVDPSDRNWAASTYKDRAVVRATDENTARQIATLAFTIATPVVRGEDVKVCPWRYPNLVRCTQLHDTDHDEDGPDAILDPARYDHEWRG